jgi:hypothetical protein
MLTDAIAELFTQYVDDSDQTFMDDATKVNFLNIAYRELAYQICEADSNIYAQQETYININDDELDLATTVLGNKIMGPNLDTTRLYRLMRVSRSETNGDVRYYLQSCNSIVEVRNDVNRYMLKGTKLLFSEQQDNILVEYVGFLTDPFTVGNIISGAGVFLDDVCSYFGDLIALLAAKHYQIKDFAQNPILMGQLNTRQNDLESYLMTGKNWNSSNQVVGTDELTYLGY